MIRCTVWVRVAGTVLCRAQGPANKQKSLGLAGGTDDQAQTSSNRMRKSQMAPLRMNIRDSIVWPKHWTTSLGKETLNAPVDKGVLVDIRAWEDHSMIIVVVRCRNGKYYGTIKTDRLHHEDVVQFLTMNMKRTLREIKQAEI